MVMQCSMRVVRITVVIDAVEDFEPVLSGVATSYKLRTRREHKDDDMLIQKLCKYVFRLSRFGSEEDTDQLATAEKEPLNVP